MWRGGKRKYGYPHQRTDLALDVWLSFPVFVSLQVAVVKFQRLDNKIRFPASGNALGNELGDPFITESRFFLLIGLLFLHNGLDNLGSELAILVILLHFDSLCQ